MFACLMLSPPPLPSSPQVFCLDFSPDLTKAVTASGDGLLKVWNINVRYHMDEDPKVGIVLGGGGGRIGGDMGGMRG